MKNSPSKYTEVGNIPVIFPDYTDITIPVNIAPLNFVIKNEGTKFRVNFTPLNKHGFSIVSGTPAIRIPLKKWKKFLASNAGQQVQLTIYIKNPSGSWEKYKPVIFKVSSDRIDPYIVYRRINAALVYWYNMAIVQRSLEDFSESDILSNENSQNNCMHAMCTRMNID
jgi:hypothetical protein